MIDIITNPDTKIATGIGTKSNTENRIATWVISATSPDQVQTYMSY